MTTTVLPDTELNENRTPSGRPFWLTAACPPWCTGDHYPYDIDDERRHIDAGDTIHFTLHNPWGPLHEPPPLHVNLVQGYREAEPVVELWAPTTDTTLKFTLTEAETLIADLAGRIAAARDEHVTPEESLR